MVTISVIIPAYNSSQYIETALNSVLTQNIDDIEIICVNDGSTDNTSEILKKYSSRYNFIKVFNQENQGPGRSRNKGVLESNGEYIAFLDADDKYLNEDALNKMYNLAIKNDADMVCANLRKIKQNGSLEENYDYENAPFTYFEKETIIKPYEYGIPWAFYKNIYKKDFLQKNNITFPDLKVGEDPIFLAKVLTSIEKIYTINTDFYGYNHSIAGGLNLKLNTYEKRKEYINHYLKTFEILNEKKFEKVQYNYKKELIEYLTFRQNINYSDIKSIISELFQDNTYFNESDYGYLIIDLLRNEQKYENQEEYEFIKYCLFEESMLENTFIDIERLIEFTKISENNTIKEQMASFMQLKKIDDYTFEEKRQINGKVDKLKINIKHFIKSNDSILNSNSWKITGLLRSIKHKSEE